MRRIDSLEKVARARGATVSQLLISSRREDRPMECICPECGERTSSPQCRLEECSRCGTQMGAYRKESSQGKLPPDKWYAISLQANDRAMREIVSFLDSPEKVRRGGSVEDSGAGGPRIKGLRINGKSREKDREMTDRQLEAARRIARRLKGAEGVDNPHALARWIVQQDESRWEKYVRTALARGKSKKSSLAKLAVIRKTPHKDEWCVYSHSGKRMGCYGSRKEAEERLQQIHFFKSRSQATPSDNPTVPKPRTPPSPGMIWMWNPEQGVWEMRPEEEQV